MHGGEGITLGHTDEEGITLGLSGGEITLGHNGGKEITLGHSGGKEITLGHSREEKITLGDTGGEGITLGHDGEGVESSLGSDTLPSATMILEEGDDGPVQFPEGDGVEGVDGECIAILYRRM